MMGKHSKSCCQIKVVPQHKFVHCSIHQEDLDAKKTGTILPIVLTEDIVMKSITSTATNTQLFFILCNQMGCMTNLFFISKLGGSHLAVC